mmetsp:Transcript_5517/g.13930  ORF Transcript_5517/g.13930 Transcript_5517/m.13930 type:complete len:369 (-) Transcript_5517:34-1140(-)
MVDETILGCVAACLERAEQGLFGTKDLQCGSRVLGQTGETASMRDEACADHLTDQGGEVRGHSVHLGEEVIIELFAVLVKLDDALGEGAHVDHVKLGNVRAHGGTRSIQHLGGDTSIADDVLKAVEIVFGEVLLVLHKLRHTSEHDVVVHQLDQLGKVPRIPLTNAHGKGVHVLVQLIEQSNTLDDHVVHTVHVEFNGGTREGVTQTKLRLHHIVRLHARSEFGKMVTNTAKNLTDSLTTLARDVQLLSDGSSKLLFGDTQRELGLLLALHLTEVHLEEGAQMFMHLAFTHRENVIKGILTRAERCKTNQFDDLTEATKVNHRLLEGIVLLGDDLTLLHLEKRIARRALKQNVESSHDSLQRERESVS